MSKDGPEVNETRTAASNRWEGWYREYDAELTAKMQPILDRFPGKIDMIRRVLRPRLDPSPAAVERFQGALAGEVEWLVETLGDERRKWFVADLAARTQLMPNDLFEPMLRASVEEVDPSFNRRFVDPCMRVFGPRRVNEYLLAVVESADDFHKVGAVNALYWAQIGVSYRLTYPTTYPLCPKPEDADQDSLAAYEALTDLWDRKRTLFLETFVSNPDLDVRRALIGKLNLDESAYPDSHKSLVPRAIQIAQEHSDDYIRECMQFHFGETILLSALPARSETDSK
jgi:hypothetical protein